MSRISNIRLFLFFQHFKDRCVYSSRQIQFHWRCVELNQNHDVGRGGAEKLKFCVNFRTIWTKSFIKPTVNSKVKSNVKSPQETTGDR